MRRREVLTGLAAGALAAVSPQRAGAQAARIVVVGGGFGGATCARELHRRGLAVTLVEPNATYVACPFSNAVVAGLREPESQRFTYEALAREGVTLMRASATGVDAARRQVALGDGARLDYDRLVLAPGVELNFAALPGYDEAAAEVMPHAWHGEAQALLLRRQLEAMEDGGTVVMTVPANPYRCPPGPYERASLVAHYLMAKKPRSKLIVLDAKDAFSKQRLFEAAWAELYPGRIEWVPLSSGGKVTEVDASAKALVTEFGRQEASVSNVIPPQRAGRIAARPASPTGAAGVRWTRTRSSPGCSRTSMSSATPP
jgi:NADPH-dependent 2,4-dienoyl-CoA reductase/sulfur reductase-like enzyme